MRFLALLLLAGCQGEPVTYRVSGHGQVVDVIVEASGGRHREGYLLPLNQTVSLPSGRTPYISVEGVRGDVSCEIEVGGKIVAQDRTSAGKPSITCTGAAIP